MSLRRGEPCTSANTPSSTSARVASSSATTMTLWSISEDHPLLAQGVSAGSRYLHKPRHPHVAPGRRAASGMVCAPDRSDLSVRQRAAVLQDPPASLVAGEVLSGGT